ncbi:MAG: ABC transporter permease [Bryobacteraceae bacterium]
MGGVLGLILAWAAIHTVRSLNPGNLPRIDEVQLNAGVLWFTLLISCLAGILFGLFPALQSLRHDIVESLREGARGTAGGVRGRNTRSALVGTEAALSLVLLVGASLLVHSLFALTEADLGFRPDHLLTMSVRVAEQQYSSEQQEAGDFERIINRLQVLPGVIFAAASTNLPSLGWNQGRKFEIVGRPWPDGELHGAGYASVSPTYFHCAGINLVKGRLFTRADRHGSQEVIVISESFAKRYFPRENPIGRQISCYSRAFKANRFRPAIPRTIVGIVSDVHHLEQVGSDTSMEMYTPQMQNVLPFSYFLVRTSSDPVSFSELVRHTVSAHGISASTRGRASTFQHVSIGRLCGHRSGARRCWNLRSRRV